MTTDGALNKLSNLILEFELDVMSLEEEYDRHLEADSSKFDREAYIRHKKHDFNLYLELRVARERVIDALDEWNEKLSPGRCEKITRRKP